MKRKIYLSNSIFTSETREPFAGAIVIGNNRIIYAGDKAGAKCFEEGAEIEDVGDKTITPGLIDCHTHAYAGGKIATGVAWEVSPDQSLDEILEGVKDFINSNPVKDGQIYMVFNYDFENMKRLMKSELEELYGKETPIAFLDYSLHGGAFTSRALELLEFDPEAPIPSGTTIVYEEDGSMGYISENLFFQLYAKLLLKDDEGNKDADKAIDYIEDLFLSNGFTTAVDMLPMGGGDIELWNERRYLERQREGTLSLRMGVCTALATDSDIWKKRRADLNGDYVFHCGLKGFADGGFMNSTAWTTARYLYGPNEGSHGGPTNDMQLYRKKIKDANDLGFPVRIHAEGDLAISEVLSMYDESNHPELLNQIEHATSVTDEVLQQIEEYTKDKNLMINMQPIFLYNEAASEEYPYSCGIDFYNRTAVRVKSIMNAGAMVSLGSTDYPVVPPDASAHIRVAVNRLSDDASSCYYKDGYMMDEAITLPEALIAMTSRPAMAINKDDCLGTLKEGKLADITIFDCNLFTMDKSEYKNIGIYKTIVDGKEVFQKTMQK